MFLPVLAAALMTLSGCGGVGGGSGDVTIDSPELSGALKFLGACSVICSLIWASTLIFGGKRHERNNPPWRRP